MRSRSGLFIIEGGVLHTRSEARKAAEWWNNS
jgi:hypothetical protein